jgi:glycosyltransferase involved in cell wall biosynthesis
MRIALTHKILWYRLSPYHRLVLTIEKRQVGCGSRRIVAVCEQTKRELIEAYCVSEKKIVVILNGVDHERFNPSRRYDSGKRIRREFGIQAKDRVVLFVGSGTLRLQNGKRGCASDILRYPAKSLALSRCSSR